MSDILKAMIEKKRKEVAQRIVHSRAWLKTMDISNIPPYKDAYQMFKKRTSVHIHVIAEIKFQSPSAGVIRTRYPGEVQNIALSYQKNGACVISVLADRPFFGGTPLDIRRVVQVVQLPVLYKGFIIDPIQMDFARMLGASMVLLLACVLDTRQLQSYVGLAYDKGLEPLVEVSNEEELEKALSTKARVIGVNARCLHSFDVSAEKALSLIRLIPRDYVRVYMSGIRKASELKKLQDMHVDAALIGQSLMQAPNPGQALASLLGDCSLAV